MKNISTIFNQLLTIVPYYKFQDIVEEFKGDRYTKKFNSFHHFIVLLFAQLNENDSLRDIERPININKGKLQFFSLPEIRRSTLSEANNRRDYKIFERLFYIMLDKTIKLTPKHKFRFNNEIYSIDSTTIDLCLSMFDWAKFRKRKGAVKIHTKLNLSGNIPDFLTITDGKCSDIRALKENFNFMPDSIIVFDKAYIDFKWLCSLTQQKVFFVTSVLNQKL